METIYWIQRLGTIHTVAWFFFWITLLFLIIFFVGACAAYDEIIDADVDDNEANNIKNIGLRTLKISSCIFGLSLLIGIFVPSEKDLYAIYGIGGTIDYIKSNDTAKQLPDKVINILDAWIDQQTPDNNKKE